MVRPPCGFLAGAVDFAEIEPRRRALNDTPVERVALGNAFDNCSARSPVDIYLNARTFWRNIPAAVWTYKLGGYQVLKKWLSYRDSSILGRSLLPEEVQHFTDTARRIGAILAATKSSHPDRNTSYGS